MSGCPRHPLDLGMRLGAGRSAAGCGARSIASTSAMRRDASRIRPAMDASDGSTSSTSDRRSSFCRCSAASATERAACSRARRRAVWIAIAAWLTATRSRCVSIAVGKSLRPADTSTRPVSHGSASGRLVTRNVPRSGSSTSVVVTPGTGAWSASSTSCSSAGILGPDGRQVSSGRPPSCGSSKRAYAPSSWRTPKSTLSRPVAISIRLVVHPHRRQREERAHVAQPPAGIRHRGVLVRARGSGSGPPERRGIHVGLDPSQRSARGPRSSRNSDGGTKNGFSCSIPPIRTIGCVRRMSMMKEPSNFVASYAQITTCS